MKNKFEALKAFQSWPKEWQQLCAEFWAESDTVGGTLPAIGDPFPYDSPKITFGCLDQGEMKIVPGPVRRAAKVVNYQRWTATQEESLVACVESCSCRSDAIRAFLKKYPGRSEAAIAIKIRGMTDANGLMHVRY